MLFGNKRK